MPRGDGYGHLVLLEGEAGIGKTRVAQEFLAEVRHAGFTVVRGRCYEHLDLAYLPLRESLFTMIADGVARRPEHRADLELLTRPDCSVSPNPPALPRRERGRADSTAPRRSRDSSLRSRRDADRGLHRRPRMGRRRHRRSPSPRAVPARRRTGAAPDPWDVPRRSARASGNRSRAPPKRSAEQLARRRTTQ